MIRAKVAAGSVIVAGGFCLLQQRSATEHEPLTWCIYGGMLEQGETAEEGCVREVHEESGIMLRPEELRHLHTIDYPENDFCYVTFITERREPCPVVHSHETRDAGWFEIGQTLDTVFDFLPGPLHSGMQRLVDSGTFGPALLRHALEHVEGERSQGSAVA